MAWNKRFETLAKITPPVNKSIRKKIDAYFVKEGYLFKETKTRTGYCTCCETRFDFDGKQYRHNDITYCPHCNSPVTIKDAGRGRGKLQNYKYVGVFQNLKGGILLLRTFLCVRDYYGSYENVQTKYEEKYRVYFKDGERLSFKNAYWQGWNRIEKLPTLEYYDLTPFYVYSKLRFDIEYINPKVIEKNKFFRYSCFETIRHKVSEYNWHRYVDLFNKHPVITEKLVKAGYINVVLAIVSPQSLWYLNYRSEDIRGFLRMNNSELRLLKDLSYEETRYAIKVKTYRLPLNHSTINYAKKEYYSYSEIKKQLKDWNIGISIDKLLNYLVKQASDFSIYKDYIRWLIKYDYELSSKRIYPRNLQKAHDEMMRYDRRMAAALKEKENRERLENFQKNILPDICNQYTFSDDVFIIRPFYSAEEMINEGQQQNICVGGNGYTSSHLEGRSIICCLRKIKEPDKSFCTVEVSKTGQIVQARMHHNQSPPEEVKQFLEKWKKYYKSHKPKNKEAA